MYLNITFMKMRNVNNMCIFSVFVFHLYSDIITDLSIISSRLGNIGRTSISDFVNNRILDQMNNNYITDK